MDMRKILITGGGGFLSSRIVLAYKDKYNITSLSRKDLDITDEKATKELIKKVKPKIIIHAAAMSATESCENNPSLAYKINVEGSLNIARVAKEIGSKMLFISTEQVFNGNIEDGPYKENNKPIPSTVYGETKLEAENLLRKEIEELWILRLSWMFGLPERGTPNSPSLFWKAITAVLTNNPIKISANEYRGITYSYDLIDNLENIFKLPYELYHFGSENEESTYDMAVFILEQIGVSKENIDRVIIKDDEKHKNKKRDLRLAYEKIKSHGINILSSKESIVRAIEDFDYKLK